MSPKEQAEAVRQAMQILKADGHPGEALWEAVVRIAGQRDQARRAFLQVEEERDFARLLIDQTIEILDATGMPTASQELRKRRTWDAPAEGITRDPDPEVSRTLKEGGPGP